MAQGMLKVEVRGMNTLLRKAGAATASKTIRRGLGQGGIFIAGWIQENRLTGPRPKYLGVVSNRLRSSIMASKAIKKGGIYRITIGTNVEYAKKHEKGLDGMRKRPFLKPGIEEPSNKQEVIRIMTREINDAIKAAK